MSETTQKKKISLVIGFLREAFALTSWSYITIKLLFFDFDYYLVNTYIPDLAPILNNKIFIFLGIISLLMIVLRKNFLSFFLYILAYPLVVIVWKIPKLFIKNWQLTIAFMPALYDIFLDFRKHFIAFALFTIATALIFESRTPYILYPSMVILILLLLLHIKASFLKAYRSNVFSKIAQKISELKDKLSDPIYLNGALTYNPNKNESDTQKEPSLTNLYIFHSLAIFIGEKIGVVAKSRKIELYLLCSWLATVISTWFTFSLVYFSIYKIYPNSFITQTTDYNLSFLSFLGLSFNKIFPYNNSLILPGNDIASIACYAQAGCSIILMVILFFTILTAARERYKEDLDLIVREVDGIGNSLQNGFQSIFKLTVSEAEASLLIENQALVALSRKIRGLNELSTNPQDQTNIITIENNNNATNSNENM